MSSADLYFYADFGNILQLNQLKFFLHLWQKKKPQGRLDMINEIFPVLKLLGSSWGWGVYSWCDFSLWWRVIEQFVFLARTCLHIFRNKGEALKECGICHMQGQLLSVGLS